MQRHLHEETKVNYEFLSCIAIGKMKIYLGTDETFMLNVFVYGIRGSRLKLWSLHVRVALHVTMTVFPVYFSIAKIRI